MTRPGARSPVAVDLVREFSLEMTGKDVPGLLEASPSIPEGTNVNVTYLGNEDQEVRVAAAHEVKSRGFVPVPHLSARRLQSEAVLREFLTRLRDVDASKKVFAVGGDPSEPEGPYEDSLALIQTGLLQEYGAEEVSIAGYPEGHPDISTEVLWRHLEQKTAALQEQQLRCVILTQFAFDVDPVVTWVREVRERGIDAEIRIGTPGPAGIKRLLSFARRFGIGANAMIVKKYGFSLTNLLGTAGPDTFVTGLSERLGELGETRTKLHFYTFGGLTATAKWAEDFTQAEA